MSQTYESINLNSLENNVGRLGTFVAWLVTNNLLQASFEQSAGTAMARVRMQDLTGAEFLTTVLNGEFKSAHLSETGQSFVESYFVSGKYNTDYESCEYSGENEWLLYDEVSPSISVAFQAFNHPRGPVRRLKAKILKFPGGHRKK